MAARRRRPNPEEAMRELYAARISELELRIKLLEARVRNVAADVRKGLPAEGEGAKSGARRPAPRVKERPRCPGCLLELPKGRRGESCVWCGFVFDAIAPERKRRASR
jgi:hypothetical protein